MSTPITNIKPQILRLYKSWSETERRMAIRSMPFGRIAELGHALISAGWTPSDLESVEIECKKDVQDKTKKMQRDEAQFVVQQLKLGLMNGREYGTVEKCGCFLGSAARAAKKTVEQFCVDTGITQDGSSPAEQWFGTYIRGSFGLTAIVIILPEIGQNVG